MIDLLPTEDEYHEDDMKQAKGLINADGTHPKFFSNIHPRVVLKHFEWMKTYGISGGELRSECIHYIDCIYTLTILHRYKPYSNAYAFHGIDTFSKQS